MKTFFISGTMIILWINPHGFFPEKLKKIDIERIMITTCGKNKILISFGINTFSSTIPKKKHGIGEGPSCKSNYFVNWSFEKIISFRITLLLFI
jgi:hypothetical protein